jgi:hypothetical protein
MGIDQSKFNVDWCVTGEKRMQELDPTFRVMLPVPNGKKGRGKRREYCPKCEQWTAVKLDGFFKRHKASSAGYKSMQDKRSGTPARVRRRS